MHAPPLGQISYLNQVRRLRSMAEDLLKSYDLRWRELRFINHGENTTFRVVTPRGPHYLLRLHRPGYHSLAAIREELSWLRSLGRSGFQVQEPIASKRGRLFEVVSGAMPSRPGALLTWKDGRFVGKHVSAGKLKSLGELTAKLHLFTRGRTVRHRNYWSAEGLIGSNPKFGSIDAMILVKPSEQRRITSYRRELYRKLRNYGAKNPQSMGLIHADLHFGNVIFCQSQALPIDFDDCGFGFHLYDLAVTLLSLEHVHKSAVGNSKWHKPWLKDRDILLNSYSGLLPLGDTELSLLSDFMMARRLCMLGWRASRADNPRVYKHLRSAIQVVLDALP